MSTDNLPPGVAVSMLPHVLESDPREDDRSDEVFMPELTGEQIAYIIKALPFYRCHADYKNSGDTLSIQDRDAIRAIEAELERVLGNDYAPQKSVAKTDQARVADQAARDSLSRASQRPRKATRRKTAG